MRPIHWGLILAASSLLAACGGGGSGGGGGGTPQSYTVGGAVSGLSGSGLVLKDNGGDSLTVPANGSFTFATPLASGAAYAVTVGTQPAGQACSVSSGSGAVSGANVTSVAVSCSSSLYTIGGSVSGLSGSGLVLKDNGGDSLTVPASGNFTFATPLANGAAYSVTIGTQPAGQACSVSSGSGTVSGANVSSVAVSCSSSLYKIGGSVSGLSGSGLVLQDNGGDSLSISASGNFTFATALASGATYAVTVGTQPANQTCTVSSGSGTVSGANVASVAVSCSNNAYSIGGTASGITAGTLVLQDNGGDNLNVSANGGFTFATSLLNGAIYAVTVQTAPAGESCVVGNGSGNVTTANVTNVSVTCSSTQHAIGGTVSGLSGSGLVLQDNGGDNLTISANGNFKFATSLQNGQAYAVTAQAQPATPAQYCTVTAGAGTVGAADVTNVAVICRTTGQYLYITTTYGGAPPNGVVTLFDIDAATGILSRDNRYTTARVQPYGIVLDTQGYGYVAYQDSNSVETITADGASPITNAGLVHTDPGSSTFVLALDPAAAYLYAGGSSLGTQGCDNPGAGELWNYSVSAGTLSALMSGPYTLDSNPCGMATDPTGQLLFLTLKRAGEIGVYSINATDGSLLELNGGAPYTFQGGVGTNLPWSIAVHPTARYLFITDMMANTVSVYSYSSGGAITLVGSPYPVGHTPQSVTVDPTGQFLYVATSGDGKVSAFTITTTGANAGTLTAITGSPFDTGQGASATPTGVAVEPSGQYLYVANGDATNISIFGINPSTGALSDIDAVPTDCPNGITCTVGGFGGNGGASVIAIQ